MSEEIFLKNIGQKLSNHRLISEITLQELSSKTGIDVEIIVGIEMGKISLGLEEFLKITEAIGIDAATIMNEIN
jgi:transcriptional regulator with XRE-family HTH domain